MGEESVKSLPCGCEARTYRDFIGRVVGTIVSKSAMCQRREHEIGQTVIMPGRENARPE